MIEGLPTNDFYQDKDGYWHTRVIPVSPTPAYACTHTTHDDDRIAVKPVEGIPDTPNIRTGCVHHWVLWHYLYRWHRQCKWCGQVEMTLRDEGFPPNG